MKDWIISAAWIAGLMTAPHSLALLGNLSGTLQWYLPVMLAVALAVYRLNSTCLAAMAQHFPLASEATPALPADVGPFAALWILTTGRVITAVTAGTVLLVTAGFSFNETFFHWFPNFAFAFLMLAVVLAVRISGPRATEIFQVFMATIALGGLGVLIVMGGWAAPAHFGTGSGGAGVNFPYPLFSVLLLFTGFDSALNHRFDPHRPLNGFMTAGMLLSAVILGLWGAVSILHVPAQKLSSSYIPHILAARNIAGDTGRHIMATVVIAASCAAVNALMGNVSSSLSRLASRWRIPGHPAAATLLCTVGIALMMVSGMAGADEIDVYVRGGLCSWLLGYAVVDVQIWRRFNRRSIPPVHLGRLQSGAGAVIMMVSFTALLSFDPDRTLLIGFMSGSWAVMAVLFLGAFAFSRRYRR